MPRKILLICLALLFVIASHLRPCLDFTVDGQRINCGCTPLAAQKALLAARAAAEEVLAAPARLPAYRCHLRLSLKPGADSAPELVRALLDSTGGIVLADMVHISGTALGAVSDRAELEGALDAYIENTLPTWAKTGTVPASISYERMYTRRNLLCSISDMILLITGLSPVIYSDGAGRLSQI